MIVNQPKIRQSPIMIQSQYGGTVPVRLTLSPNKPTQCREQEFSVIVKSRQDCLWVSGYVSNEFVAGDTRMDLGDLVQLIDRFGCPCGTASPEDLLAKY